MKALRSFAMIFLLPLPILAPLLWVPFETREAMEFIKVGYMPAVFLMAFCEYLSW